ncbi:hypothetical protein CFAM422_002695 [Trichoderma lentiforme]|uniref:Uncharacterized protein n=1 Tax=Trichoderma lentiforme TaxID=1567552 RepID=A0A9P4XN65_9HYPO|nr:hypothetical protein CFAM422_002695 [Trichoderma lentiforme]
MLPPKYATREDVPSIHSPSMSLFPEAVANPVLSSLQNSSVAPCHQSGFCKPTLLLRLKKHSPYPKVPHGSAELTAVTDQQQAVFSATQS